MADFTPDWEPRCEKHGATLPMYYIIPSRDDLPVYADGHRLGRATAELLWELQKPGGQSLVGATDRQVLIPEIRENGRVIQPQIEGWGNLLRMSREAFEAHGGFEVSEDELGDQPDIQIKHGHFLRFLPPKGEVITEDADLSPLTAKMLWTAQNYSTPTKRVVGVRSALGEVLQRPLDEAQIRHLVERNMARYGGLRGLDHAINPYQGCAKIQLDHKEPPVEPEGIMTPNQTRTVGVVLRVSGGNAIIPERKDSEGRVTQPFLGPEEIRAVHTRSLEYYGGNDELRRRWSEALSKTPMYRPSADIYEAKERWRERQERQRVYERGRKARQQGRPEARAKRIAPGG